MSRRAAAAAQTRRNAGGRGREIAWGVFIEGKVLIFIADSGMSLSELGLQPASVLSAALRLRKSSATTKKFDYILYQVMANPLARWLESEIALDKTGPTLARGVPRSLKRYCKTPGADKSARAFYRPRCRSPAEFLCVRMDRDLGGRRECELFDVLPARPSLL